MTANDLAISIGQWIPDPLHQYGFYFIGITFLLLLMLFLSFDRYHFSIASRTKFKTFEELKLTCNILINHFLNVEMNTEKKVMMYGILSQHILYCSKPDCFCRRDTVFDVAKNKMVDIDRRYCFA